MLVFLICFLEVYCLIILVRNWYIHQHIIDWVEKVYKVNAKMIKQREYNDYQLEWYNNHFNQLVMVLFMFWIWSQRQMMKDKVIYDFVVDKLEEHV